jgi:ferredoxin-thioredoxin reductase catalytic subunit
MCGGEDLLQILRNDIIKFATLRLRIKRDQALKSYVVHSIIPESIDRYGRWACPCGLIG